MQPSAEPFVMAISEGRKWKQLAYLPFYTAKYTTEGNKKEVTDFSPEGLAKKLATDQDVLQRLRGLHKLVSEGTTITTEDDNIISTSPVDPTTLSYIYQTLMEHAELLIKNT